MRQRMTGGLVLVAFVLLGGASAVAHHAFDTEFDAKKPVTLRGIVTKVEWTNPHVWFYLNVKNDKGEVENWGFEMGGRTGSSEKDGHGTRSRLATSSSSKGSWPGMEAETSTPSS